METVSSTIQNTLRGLKMEQENVSEQAHENSDPHTYTFAEIDAIEQVSQQIVFAERMPASSPVL